jgi:ribosomal protein S30
MKREATWKVTNPRLRPEHGSSSTAPTVRTVAAPSCPPKLRWQVTPCARCRRPLHQRSAIVDEEGRVLWPPEGVPRPPDEGQHGVRVQYVVTAEDDRDWRAIWSSTPREVRARERRARSDAWTYLGCLVVAVVILAVVLNLLLWALNLP